MTPSGVRFVLQCIDLSIPRSTYLFLCNAGISVSLIPQALLGGPDTAMAFFIGRDAIETIDAAAMKYLAS